MIFSRYIETYLSGIRNVEEGISELRNYIDELIVQCDPIELRSARYSLRLLNRWIQLTNKLISEKEFLIILHDFILFIGKIEVPESVKQMVLKFGPESGLYMEVGSSVAALRPELGVDGTSPLIPHIYSTSMEHYNAGKPVIGDAMLSTVTRFSRYRSLDQKIAVHTALSMLPGHTMLLSLSTGAGKSLVTQMLGALSEGMTLVIVPTIALGKDQHRAARNVLSGYLDEDAIVNYCGEQLSVLPLVIQGLHERRIRLLFTSPEALVHNLRLRRTITEAAKAGYLKNLVIDEAHIVQEWGALFRPDFQFLSCLRRELLKEGHQVLRTYLLSATVTEDSVVLLRELFSEVDCFLEVRSDSLRMEPRLIIENIQDEKTHVDSIIRYVKTLPKPMLIYEIKPEDANHWAQLLAEQGYLNHAVFTGETSDRERSDIISRWNADEIDIVFATSAFGMGIDKPDVRTVLHASLPENINRFYQEIGRGGRDGLPSLAVLCTTTHANLKLQEKIANGRLLRPENMLDRWFSMLQDPSTTRSADLITLNTAVAPSSFSYAEKERKGSLNISWNLNLILFLVRNRLVEFVDMQYEASSRTYVVTVRTRDRELMNNKSRLENEIVPIRNKEIDSIRVGLDSMKKLRKNSRQECWAVELTAIYPYTSPSCGGCPNHSTIHGESYHLPLQKDIPNTMKPQVLGGAPWYGNPLILLSMPDGYASSCLPDTMIRSLSRFGIHTWVSSSTTPEEASQFAGMILNPEEAEWLLPRHEMLFTRGVIVSFTNQDNVNQKLYRMVEILISKGIPTILHAKPSTSILTENKTLEHLVNARILTYQEALED